MVLNSSTETIRLIRDGENGGEGGGGIIPIATASRHYKNDFCKTGSDQSHFRVNQGFVIVSDKVTRQCLTDHNL